jgi:hypothetical protein
MTIAADVASPMQSSRGLLKSPQQARFSSIHRWLMHGCCHSSGNALAIVGLIALALLRDRSAISAQ